MSRNHPLTLRTHAKGFASVAIKAESKAVDSSAAVLLVPAVSDGLGQAAFIKNTGADPVYIGGSGVTDATGFPVAANEVVGPFLDLLYDDAIYGICAATQTATVKVIYRGA